jgi:hypothetical protein
MAGEVMPAEDNIELINITAETALSLAGIGFGGGLLSGFLGTGGAFIMTPAMMSLGVPGIMAVAANITHKFGKSIIGSKKHIEFGNVDKKLGLTMFIPLFAGMKSAVTINKMVLESAGVAGSNLYISVVFILVLAGVAVFIFRDITARRREGGPPRDTGGNFCRREKLLWPPVMHYEVADIRVSLWLILLVGFLTGFLAGTIGVGGFIGVPAMIYLMGVPVRVAAGTELFISVFSGMQGTFLYALGGYVDLRIPLLLYLGSIVGVTLGAVVSRVAHPLQIKLVMASVITMVVLSRAATFPVYLSQMGYLAASPGVMESFSLAGSLFLFGSGVAGCGLILFWLFRALKGNRRPAGDGRQTITR